MLEGNGDQDGQPCGISPVYTPFRQGEGTEGRWVFAVLRNCPHQFVSILLSCIGILVRTFWVSDPFFIGYVPLCRVVLCDYVYIYICTYVAACR